MNNILYEIKMIIINLLNFKDKINLYKTSKKYKFIISTIYEIPNNLIYNIIDIEIQNLTNITKIKLSYNNVEYII